MIYLNKGTALLVTNFATNAISVQTTTDDDLLNEIEAIKDIKKKLTDEHLRVIRTLGQVFVINNAEKLRRGLKEQTDNQLSIFDYEEETKLLK